MKLVESSSRAPFSTRLLGIVILLATVASHAETLGQKLAESPWPTYRGDLKRTGRSHYKGPDKNQLRWVFSTGLSEKHGGIETDPVIAADGSVYTGTNNGIFYALSPEDGSIRWVFPTAFDTFAIYSSPIVDQQGLVYFGAKDGNLYALKAPKRGILAELVWSINLRTTIETSPALTPDGTLVIGTDDWAYYGITPPRGDTGPRIKWRFQTQGTLISSPVVASDGTVFVASMDGKIYALEPPKNAGQPVKVRWSFSSGGRDGKGGFENAPAIDNEGTLYIGGNDGILYALDTQTGQTKWTFDGVARSGYRTYAIFSSVAIGPDRTIYFGGKDGYLYAIRDQKSFFRSSPEVVWRYKLGPGIQSSPLLAADGTVYLGDERGDFHAIRPPASGEWGTSLWNFSTKGTLISSPALAADGTLYEGSMDGKLYAFNAGSAKPRAVGPFSGTWYGTYESSLVSGKVRAVLRQEGRQVWGAWFLTGAGRGEGMATAQDNRLTLSFPLKTARCQGSVRGGAQRNGNQIRAEIQIDNCGGQVVTGKLIVSNR
jgi:outer membrane protein assembly factor BamB